MGITSENTFIETDLGHSCGDSLSLKFASSHADRGGPAADRRRGSPMVGPKLPYRRVLSVLYICPCEA